jgi:thioesterase domain-containing protein
MNATALERYLHEKIPLARAMEVHVEACRLERLVLTAPLRPNHNHLGTAFGGSLSVLATLAGYSYLWVALGDAGGHIVIRASKMNFQRPVRGELRAICRGAAEEALAQFRFRYAARGKARLNLAVTIEEAGEIAVEFEGTFVAIAPEPPTGGVPPVRP